MRTAGIILAVAAVALAFPAPRASSNTFALPDDLTAVLREIGFEVQIDGDAVAAGGESSVLALRDGAGTPRGCAVFRKSDNDPVLAELLLDNDLLRHFDTEAPAAAQRAVGSTKALGPAQFSHDGLLSLNLSFLYSDKADGTAEGRVAVDVLTGRLSLPGAAAEGAMPPPTEAPAEATRLLEVPRFKTHLTHRATALAMMFAYIAEHGFPEVGPKEAESGSQTRQQYIEEFSRACGACSERTATEVFITGRKMMARIGTHRISGEKPSAELGNVIVSEIGAGRPVYARITTANVNHYLVISGYVRTESAVYLAARRPAADESADLASGYVFFRLPAHFDSVPSSRAF